MLKKTLAATVLGLMLTMPAHAFGLKTLTGGDDSSSSLSSLSSLASLSSLGDLSGFSDNALVSSLTSATGTSTEESAAGSGMLLALAGSSLAGDQASELSSLVPGYSQLTSLVPSGVSLDSLSQVMELADTLGIDASTITSYAPKILEYVSGQGASTSLLSSLSSIWGVAQ